jgi:hypothetical protein
MFRGSNLQGVVVMAAIESVAPGHLGRRLSRVGVLMHTQWRTDQASGPLPATYKREGTPQNTYESSSRTYRNDYTHTHHGRSNNSPGY